LNYIADQYGQKIISGQQDTSWTTNTGLSNSIDMIARIFTATGKYPAIKGFDLIQLPYPNSPYFAGMEQIDEAVEWWEGKNNNTKLLPDQGDIHGIVTICWHWRIGPNNAFYAPGAGRPDGSNETTLTIPWTGTQLDVSSPVFQTLQADMDKVADLLQILKDKDIPVLWRPLHEAAGNWRYGDAGWFWWGASGPYPYIALWEYMYSYFTYVKGLDNLIWVWNGQHKDWFPDPDTLDIVSFDVYAEDHGSSYDTFIQTRDMVPLKNRIVAMSENGRIPDPDACKRDNAMWSWFCTWNDSGANDGFSNAEVNNTVYNHDLVITLDELPDLTKYRLE
jgi:mannan endo-1,4-beta-mannosidase